MDSPFIVAVSSNLVTVRFLGSFHHTIHYRGLINGVLTITAERITSRPWALLVDWGKLFVQIPEEEKLCMRLLQEHQKKGLAYVVNVTPKHPIVDWQMEKLTGSHPELDIVTVDTKTDGLNWLNSKSIDTETQDVPFNRNWLQPSQAFTSLIQKYNIAAEKFDAI